MREVRAKLAFSLPQYLVGVIWLVSLGFMIWAALAPAPDDVLYLALGAFIGCSAAWIALQLSQPNRAPRSVLLGAGLLLFAVGVAGIAWHPNNVVTVGGFVSAYLGFGFLVELFREWTREYRWMFWAGLGLLVGGALVILVLSVVFLRNAALGTFPAIVLGACALGAFPVGLNIVSEKAVIVLQQGGGGEQADGAADGRRGRILRWAWSGLRWVRTRLRTRSGWAVTGLVLSAVPVVALTAVSNSGWTVLIAAACVLALMAALVSDTQADIAVVLCVIALLGIAPAEVHVALAQPLTAGKSAPPADLLALGDSYMSGEGAKTYINDTDEGGNNTCRRAPTAYAVMAVGPETPFDHVTFLACSGARTNNVLPQSPAMKEDCKVQHHPADDICPQDGESGTQVDQITALTASLPGGYKPSLAILSLGGNDAGFADLGEACISPGDCTKEQNIFLGNLRRVQPALVKTYQSIRAALPDTPVVVVPYPQPLYGTANCGAIALTVAERNFIRNFLMTLDKVIKSAADQVGFYYMDTMENALAAEHLQLCDPKNQGGYGINFVSPESVAGLPDQRFNPGNWLHDSFHPNEQGHQAMLDTFVAWLTAHPHPAANAPSDPASPKAAEIEQTLPPAPSCHFSAHIPADDCTLALRKWEFGQILALWPYSLLALAMLLGLWMLSVAGLSYRPVPPQPRPDDTGSREPAEESSGLPEPSA